MKISILGTGWLGSELFKSLVANNDHEIWGSTSNEVTKEALTQFAEHVRRLFDAEPENFPLNNPSIRHDHRMLTVRVPETESSKLAFFSTDLLIITLPPGRRRGNVKDLYTTEIKAIIQRAEQYGIQHLIYTSSTGVYGNNTGLVDENTLVTPTTDSNKAVVEAENLFQQSSVPSTVLRLAGLYGPERHPGRWFAGKEQLPESEAPVNLVHRYDVISAIEAVIKNGPPAAGHEVFNVCALAHPTKAEFYGRAIVDYGGTVPKMLAGGGAGKQIDSSKIRRQLNWRPLCDNLPLRP